MGCDTRSHLPSSRPCGPGAAPALSSGHSRTGASASGRSSSGREMSPMYNPDRRRFIAASAPAGLLLTPLAACSGEVGPRAWKPIAWDRDACVRCNMRIADHPLRRATARGLRDNTFTFDDVGCLVFWLEEQRTRFRGWTTCPPGCGWRPGRVRASRRSPGWIRARPATSSSARRCADLAASAAPAADAHSLSYEEMRRKTLARGK